VAEQTTSAQLYGLWLRRKTTPVGQLLAQQAALLQVEDFLTQLRAQEPQANFYTDRTAKEVLTLLVKALGNDAHVSIRSDSFSGSDYA
jgi:hypothetical protein